MSNTRESKSEPTPSITAFHGPARYAHQLLARTVDSLATASSDVRSRLLQGHTQRFIH